MQVSSLDRLQALDFPLRPSSPMTCVISPRSSDGGDADEWPFCFPTLKRPRQGSDAASDCGALAAQQALIDELRQSCTGPVTPTSPAGDGGEAEEEAEEAAADWPPAADGPSTDLPYGGDFSASFLSGHGACIRACAFSADGSMVVSCGDDRTVRAWDVATGQCAGVFSGHASPVFSCSFSPHAAGDPALRIVSAGCFPDPSVRLWDVGAALWGRVAEQATAGFADADGGCAAAAAAAEAPKKGARPGSAQARAAPAAAACVGVLPGHAMGAAAAKFSPCGSLVASCGSDMLVKVWAVAPPEADSPEEAARFAAASWPRRAPVALLAGHRGRVSCLDWRPDGEVLVSGSWDYSLILWDLSAAAADGAPLPAKLQPARIFTGHTNGVTGCCFSPDGESVLSCSMDRTMRLWDVESGAVMLVFSSAAFERDDGEADAAEQQLLADPARAEKAAAQGNAPLPPFFTACAFSACGRFVASGESRGERSVRVWCAATGACLFRLPSLSHGGLISSCSVAFSPGGDLLCSGGGGDDMGPAGPQRLSLSPLAWSPASHRYFPPKFRAAARTALLCIARGLREAAARSAGGAASAAGVSDAAIFFGSSAAAAAPAPAPSPRRLQQLPAPPPQAAASASAPAASSSLTQLISEEGEEVAQPAAAAAKPPCLDLSWDDALRQDSFSFCCADAGEIILAGGQEDLMSWLPAGLGAAPKPAAAVSAAAPTATALFRPGAWDAIMAEAGAGSGSADDLFLPLLLSGRDGQGAGAGGPCGTAGGGSGAAAAHPKESLVDRCFSAVALAALDAMAEAHFAAAYRPGRLLAELGGPLEAAQAANAATAAGRSPSKRGVPKAALLVGKPTAAAERALGMRPARAAPAAAVEAARGGAKRAGRGKKRRATTGGESDDDFILY